MPVKGIYSNTDRSYAIVDQKPLKMTRELRKSILFIFFISVQLASYGLKAAANKLPAAEHSFKNINSKNQKKAAFINTANADSCKAGPKVMAITNISSSYLNGQFYGVDVFRISWSIKDAKGNIVRKGEVSPPSNNPLITFEPLAAGNYTLIYTGKNCVSAPSSGKFVIPASINANARTANSLSAPQTVAKGMDEHMNLSFTKSGDAYIIKDQATPSVGKDYELRYMIGAKVVTSSKPLDNYIISGTNPLRIWKMKTKIGLDNTNHWSDRNNDSYFSTTAGEGFTYNTSAAFHTLVFPGASDPSGFINPVPRSYNAALQNNQWADITPDMKLPKGHVWIAAPDSWGIEKVMAKGVTHIPHHLLPWNDGAKVVRLKDAGITYNNVPRTEVFMHLKPSGADKWVDGYNLKYWPKGPLTKEQAIQKANEADISDAIWIGETMEGESSMPVEQPMWGYFYKRLKERYVEKWGARNIPFYIAHNYFMFWPGEMSLGQGNSREHFKSLLRLPADKLPKTSFSPGATLSNTNLIPEAVYIGAPDIQQGQVYQSIFRMKLVNNMGYDAGIFLFGVHEWRPNNLYQYNYPDGKFFVENKLPLDPNVIIANGFIAQVYGKLYVEWGGNGKAKAKTFEDGTKGLWFPNGAAQPQQSFPHFKKQGDDSYFGYSGSTDFSYFSQKLYNDTFGQVNGGVRKYLKHKIDNGKWISPSQQTVEEVIDAYYDQRGFVLSETKNGKTAWFYLNSFADNVPHTLEVELPDGTTTKVSVAGNGVHAKIN